MQEEDGYNLALFKQELEDNPDGKFKGQVIQVDPRRGAGGQNQREEFQALRARILGLLLRNIQDRFPHVDLLDAMQVCTQYMTEILFQYRQ